MFPAFLTLLTFATFAAFAARVPLMRSQPALASGGVVRGFEALKKALSKKHASRAKEPETHQKRVSIKSVSIGVSGAEA